MKTCTAVFTSALITLHAATIFIADEWRNCLWLHNTVYHILQWRRFDFLYCRLLQSANSVLSMQSCFLFVDVNWQWMFVSSWKYNHARQHLVVDCRRNIKLTFRIEQNHKFVQFGGRVRVGLANRYNVEFKSIPKRVVRHITWPSPLPNQRDPRGKS